VRDRGIFLVVLLLRSGADTTCALAPGAAKTGAQ
jgi:hypothetical protein